MILPLDFPILYTLDEIGHLPEGIIKEFKVVLPLLQI